MESPGYFCVKFPGRGKSWKISLVLESQGNFNARSWKVLEFSRLCMWEADTMISRCICQNSRVNNCENFSDNLFAIFQ